jgi:DNA-binding winged helix-turn-helix (wHTH) protein
MYTNNYSREASIVTRGELQAALDRLAIQVPAASGVRPVDAWRRPVAEAIRIVGFGPFRAEVDGEPVPLPPITSTVLARLVLAHGGLVEADALYRECWPYPMRTIRREQRVAVHKRIAMIRSVLHASARSTPEVLFTERAATTGYRLILDSTQVDIHHFEDLILRAGAGRDNVAVDLLVQALALWRERPLLGLHDQGFVRAGVARLIGLRDRACRELVSVAAAVARERDALVALDHLQAAQPEDAGLRQLVTAWRAALHDRVSV